MSRRCERPAGGTARAARVVEHTHDHPHDTQFFHSCHRLHRVCGCCKAARGEGASLSLLAPRMPLRLATIVCSSRLLKRSPGGSFRASAGSVLNLSAAPKLADSGPRRSFSAPC